MLTTKIFKLFFAKTCHRSLLLVTVFGIYGCYAGELHLDADAIAGCKNNVVAPPPTSRAPANAKKILPPAKGMYPGFYNIGSTLKGYNDFSTKTGKPPAIVYTFHDFVAASDANSSSPKIRTFSEPLEGESTLNPLSLARKLAKKGSVLALAWAIECCDFSSISLWYNLSKPNNIVPRILKGDFDGQIRKAAKQIKRLNLPIMLALFGEYHPQAWFLFGQDGRTQINNTKNICNQYGDPAWPDGPERVRDTYRHIIDLFRQVGVKNVTWLMYTSTRYMDPTDEDFTPWMHPQYFYPGDDYIDWIGQSAYFIDPDNRPDVKDEVKDIATALKSGYDAWTSVTDRPMMIPEFAALGDGSHSRAKILAEVLTDYLPRLPQVKAFALANSVLFEAYFQIPLLGTHPDELTMWKNSVVNNPAFVYSIKYQ